MICQGERMIVAAGNLLGHTDQRTTTVLFKKTTINKEDVWGDRRLAKYLYNPVGFSRVGSETHMLALNGQESNVQIKLCLNSKEGTQSRTDPAD
eukprot:SAG31_NODE_761_length_12276_cov_4.530673_13_plen_94_part_00